jgi:peptide/nickel transport system permease protein
VTRTQALGAALLATMLGAAALAPALAPNPPGEQFPGMALAPPMLPRVLGPDGLRRPFIYPIRVTDRLLGTWVEDTSRPVTLAFFSGGRLVSAPGAVWLPLGGDASSRDVLARVLDGARRSLGVAALAVLLTLLLGTLAGALAGYAGGATDTTITSLADFVLVLPVLYAVVTMRAAMPLTLSPTTIFWTLVIVMAAASWPIPARVVRAVVATERSRGYAEAAYAAGAGPWRILHRHVMPAVLPQVALQGLLLFPAFIFAEATLSFLGLGFAEPLASWGQMLEEASGISAMTNTPWLLAPAAAIVLTVTAVHLLVADKAQP